MELSEEQKSGPDMVLDVCNVLADSVKAMKKELKDIYVDEELPLAERWYLFVNTPECLREHSPWILHTEAIDRALESGDYFHKYETVDLVDILEWGCNEDLDDAGRDRVRMEILKEGVHSFKFDW